MAEPERTGARAAGAAADAASSRRRPAAVAAEAPPPPPLLAPHHPAGPPLPAPARAPGSRSLRQLSPGRGSTRTHANPGRQRAGPRRAQRGVRGRAAARIGAAGPTGGPGPGRRGEEERARVRWGRRTALRVYRSWVGAQEKIFLLPCLAFPRHSCPRRRTVARGSTAEEEGSRGWRGKHCRRQSPVYADPEAQAGCAVVHREDSRRGRPSTSEAQGDPGHRRSWPFSDDFESEIHKHQQLTSLPWLFISSSWMVGRWGERALPDICGWSLEHPYQRVWGGARVRGRANGRQEVGQNPGKVQWEPLEAPLMPQRALPRKPPTELPHAVPPRCLGPSKGAAGDTSPKSGIP
uniref:uncharacterized protein LOC103793415 n=1 Tax=Callithrix jacchus TaxID=9483 RepID=UPI0023DD6469|nr:uncharacterized protein LOC103793415 [Callithrix jacchus]